MWEVILNIQVPPKPRPAVTVKLAEVHPHVPLPSLVNIEPTRIYLEPNQNSPPYLQDVAKGHSAGAGRYSVIVV